MRAVTVTRVGLLVLAAACGTEEPGKRDGGAEPPPLAERYLPLVVEARWSYRVTAPEVGLTATKHSTVEALEELGGEKAGISAFRIRTETGGAVTVSWHEQRGLLTLRHLEEARAPDGGMEESQRFEPYKLRFDHTEPHLVPGASWGEAYVEHLTRGETTRRVSKTEAWTVEAVDEQVTVPAGTFSCIRVRRRSLTGQSDKTYWFARGVGKVKESGGQLEELETFTIPGVTP